MQEKKVALVTGATRGIGKSIVEKFSHNGIYTIFCSANSNEEGQKLAHQLKNTFYQQTDITDAKDCQFLIDMVIKKFGQIDFLINNAAMSIQIPHENIDAISDELFLQFLNFNVVSQWRLCRLALPYLKQSKNGNIIFMSSIAGKKVMGSSIPYAVSKSALDHMTRLLAKASAPVRVNAVSPGFITTPRTDSWEEIKRNVVAKTVLQRAGCPEEIADAVFYLLNSHYITGEIITIDGGYSLA